MKYFRAVAVRAIEPDPDADPARTQVTISLDCGCVVTRVVDRSRVVTAEPEPGRAAGLIVAGKFICKIHSPEPGDPQAASDTPKSKSTSS